MHDISSSDVPRTFGACTHAESDSAVWLVDVVRMTKGDASTKSQKRNVAT